MYELPQSLFDVYALSLPRGHGFGDRPPIAAWGTEDGLTCGVITRDVNDGRVGVFVMRRRLDDVWTVKVTEDGFGSVEEARDRLGYFLREGDAREPLQANKAPRPALYDLRGRTPSDMFTLLKRPSHHRAAWILNQLYLALPRPDRNWAADCQTGNFHTRLWEAQLLASFREQGLLVTQPFESPDFRIENREGGEGWVEAVTANPSVPYNHLNAPPSEPPASREQRFFGPAAVRFAKTLGNKLARNYHGLAHVAGKPFMIAIADFQAPSSMVWSDRSAELSAVIFSNACSIAKFNRVVISAAGAPEGLRYTRVGNFFDRTPGALAGIPFCLDITSREYRNLWPHGYEPWSAELEVFHNPFARYPMSRELLPEATHWFEHDGELICSAVYEHSILWSQTYIQNVQDPAPQLENSFPPRSDAEA